MLHIINYERKSILEGQLGTHITTALAQISPHVFYKNQNYHYTTAVILISFFSELIDRWKGLVFKINSSHDIVFDLWYTYITAQFNTPLNWNEYVFVWISYPYRYIFRSHRFIFYQRLDRFIIKPNRVRIFMCVIIYVPIRNGRMNWRYI